MNRQNPPFSAVHGLSYHLLTLGCPKNEVDSDLLETRLAAAGWRRASHPREASVLMVNTCSFIASALEETVEEVLELADLKAETGARLVVAGCMVARYGVAVLEELLPEVDVFLPFEGYLKVAEILQRCVAGDLGGEMEDALPEWEAAGGRGVPARAGEGEDVPCPGLTPYRRISSTLERGFVYIKIAEGCSRRCTFCTIPAIRGRLRSRTVEDIRDEALFFASRGAREMVLVAQDTTGYGRDIYGMPRLHRLLEELAALEGDFRIRVMYMHPEGLDGQVMRAMRDPRVCSYLDLPFQHADEGVLRAMGRRGDARSYLELLERARERLGEVAVRATLMVGFPGESREAYARLRRFVREARFDWLALFGYSREEGTPAFSLPVSVRKETVRSRIAELTEIQEEIMREKASGLVGRELDVLVEGKSPEAPGFWEGRSWREAPEVDGVIFIRDAPGVQPGTCRKVRIVSTEGIDLHGVVAGEKG
ncbi:MAG: 30S ribosomal protein S12 methylthiotransferase RimO [Actinomycetota bacterium]|nr:30S ribosomal protein S12 methylthiotransferase RimO [Actinomycetota bacterium]